MVRRTYPTSPRCDGAGDPAHARRWQYSTGPPPPCTQSGASVEFRVVILVLSKHFFVFSARVSLKQRAIKTRTPTRHRRIITPRSGLGTFSARLVFWKAEIKARTSVPLPGTCGSRRARPVRFFHGAVHTTVSTGRGLRAGADCGCCLGAAWCDCGLGGD